MDSGIHDDQNFYARRPLAHSPDLHQHDPYSRLDPSTPERRDPSAFRSTSPEVPPALPFLTTANLQAATSNGFGSGLSAGIDPDDFYREFKSPPQPSNGYSDLAADEMTTKTANPRHPTVTVARNSLKSPHRSVSEPVNERAALSSSKTTPALNGASQYGKPSVKDLLKRFDQNNEPPSVIARKPAPRVVARDPPSSGPGYTRNRAGSQARSTTSSQTNSPSRPGVSTRSESTASPSATSRPVHRARATAEDCESNTSLSITTRTSLLKNAAPNTIAQASKSMTNLSPTISTPSSQVPARKPLFGEILPAQGQPEVGHGIPQTPRRTSESGLRPSPSLGERSTLDISPSSPTAWYLGVTPAMEDVDPNKPRDTSPSHSRNHRNSADIKLNTSVRGVGVLNNGFTNSPIMQMHEVARTVSRLPISTRRLSSQSESSSPTSPVSNSAASSKPHVIARRKPDQNSWNTSSAGRSKTPTGHNTTPNATTSPPRQSTRRTRVPEKLNTNASSLKAYISAPPPKESPPLRSSRPRQPVSSASTTTRQGSIDASGSPQRGAKSTRSGEGHERRARRNIQPTPADFAAHRERIQRAYTKSIHENEQREIRAANLRRLNERYARLQEERESQRQAKLEAARAAAEGLTGEEEKESSERDASPSEEPSINESIPAPLSSPRKSLQITTSFLLPDEDGPPREQDSPTLGMPGRFLDDEEPASAVTDATATTEFDNEQQTEPPELSSSSLPAATPSEGMLSSSIFQWSDLSVEQATYGIRHSLSMTPNSADASSYTSPVEEYQQEHTPTKDLFLQELSVPGSYKHDSTEYNPQSFAARVATPSPKRTPPPPQSRTATPLKAINQVNDHGNEDAQYSSTSQVHPPPRIMLHPEPESTDTSSTPSMPSHPPHMGLNETLDYLRTPSAELNYESSGSYGGMNTSGSDSYDALYDQVHNVGSLSQNQVSSQRSSWTNDSIGTTESSAQGEYIDHTPVTATAETEQYNLPTSHQKFIEPPRRESPNNHADAALTADGAFDITFSEPPAVPLWPTYTPPPPPEPPQQDYVPLDTQPQSSPPRVSNKQPASGFYQSSQSETARNTESPRASDDVGSARASIYTPRSSTQISLEGSTANQSFESKDVLIEATEEEKKAAEKMKKRLFQRRMLIKELIDTESVYLKDMNVVEEIYKGTAEACPKLDGNDIKIIFRNTDEIVAFSTMFLDELKTAGASVYSQRSQRKSKAVHGASTTTSPPPEDRFSVAATLTEETDDQKDRRTFIGANFGKHLKKMQTIYTDFLKNSEQASAKLTSLQADGAVKVWLSECNLVAKDLTAAWDIDALLVKPVQRITRYQLLLAQIFEHTSEDHPDWQALRVTVEELASLLKNIDDLKKRIQMVGKIVGRKRKESDVRTGIAKAFGRRNDKIQAANVSRLHDDEVYRKLHEKFGDDYLRLQVVLRDVEYYTRETTTYVRKFLEHLSSIELLMRIGTTQYPELESKWVRFNISMRDIGTVALEDHVGIVLPISTKANSVQLASVRLKVIEPFELVIQLYGPPGLAMKKRNKRRLDYEKYLSLKGQGKKIDEKLQEMVNQYEALNETLKHELPKLSTMTERIGNICLVQFINIQTLWYGIWQDKVRTVLEDSQMPKDIADIVSMFTRDFKYVEARAQELGIVNGSFLTATPKPRMSQSTQSTNDPKGRPSNLSSRSRTLSFNSDKSPSLPTPDFEKNRHSGQFAFSPITVSSPGMSQFSHQNSTYSNGHSRNGSLTPGTPDPMSAFGTRPNTSTTARPNTSRSVTSDAGTTRPSNDYSSQYRRESGSTSNSGYRHVDGPPQSTRPFSGIFHSAMPLPDGPEDSQRSSRASSRDRNVSDGYNILYLAASLFEFNISATKSEAGYPYLTYQAGEVRSDRFLSYKIKLTSIRSSMSLARKASFGWPKTRMI